MSVGLGESAGQCFVQQGRQRFSDSHEISLIGRNIRGDHISGLREDLQGCLALIGEVAVTAGRPNRRWLQRVRAPGTQTGETARCR